MKPYAIISLLGKHNIIGASNSEINAVLRTADDMSRIFTKYYNGANVIINNSIGGIYQSTKNNDNNIVIYLGTENVWNEWTPLFPSYKNNKYRNLYFYVENPVYYSKSVLDNYEFPQVPTYPLVGTDMQKVNLLDKYMN